VKPEELARAVERLRNTEVEVRPVTRGDDPHDGAYIEISLAELIEAVDEASKVGSVQALLRVLPRLKAALVALVRAINGEGER